MLRRWAAVAVSGLVLFSVAQNGVCELVPNEEPELHMAESRKPENTHTGPWELVRNANFQAPPPRPPESAVGMSCGGE